MKPLLPALLCALGLAAAAAAAPPPALLRLEQQTTVPAGPVDGLHARELSALAWDASTGELVAASDRGLLFRIAIDDSGGRLVATPHSAHRIDQGRDAEALHGRPGAAGEAAQLWMLTETSGFAVRLGARGERLDSRPWPMARTKGAGAEAMAWLPDAGLLVALQRAQRHDAAGQRRHRHVVHADGGRWWAFEPAAPRSHVKAIEALPGERLLVLERVSLAAAAGGTPRYRTVLRLLALRGCGQAIDCNAAEVPVLPSLSDGPDNFEGLACATDGRCWIVSDSGPDAATPTRLLQLTLELP